MENRELKNTITYLPNHKIDKAKWDDCIDASSNGIIYAKSFFLDAMAKHWDALVLNDYDFVLPLIWNKKYGFKYLYQPAFTRFTGVFGKDIKTELQKTFLSVIPEYFKYWDIDLVENFDPFNLNLPVISIQKRRNFFLDLNKPYENINNEYKRLANRMIKKAKENNLQILKDESPESIINFYKDNYKKKQKNISESDYKNLITACAIAFKNGNASTYLAKVEERTVAVYMVLKDEKFVYSLIGGSNQEGKNIGAFYLLTDAAIKDNAATKRIFRFEGSDKKGIALFNSQFNATATDYYNLKLNNLPWPLKLLK